MTKGMRWLKYHVAKNSRHELGICEASTLKIVHIANQLLIAMSKKKDEREALRLELVAGGFPRSMPTTNI
jgi:hypothetical protein